MILYLNRTLKVGSMFEPKHLEFFENSCKHYSLILENSVQQLIFQFGSSFGDVLELGAGAGGFTKVLCENIEFKSYCALDIDNTLLTLVDKFLINSKYVELIESDAIVFLNSTGTQFDLITSSFLVHNMPLNDKTRLFRLLSKQLKQDGLFLLVDKIGKEKNTDLNSLQLQIGEFFDYSRRSKFDDTDSLEYWVNHYINDEKQNLRYDEVQLEALASQFGLEAIYKSKRYNMDMFYIFKKLI